MKWDYPIVRRCPRFRPVTTHGQWAGSGRTVQPTDRCPTSLFWTAPAGYCPVVWRGHRRDPDIDRVAMWREHHDTTHYRLWACDHIVPLIDGGPNEDANLQLLCEPCHKEKTAREAAERAAKRRAARPVVAGLCEQARLVALRHFDSLKRDYTIDESG